jgi:hypothetical protein
MIKNNNAQAWIHSATADGLFILAPPLLISLIILSLQNTITALDSLPVTAWAILIIGVDVAHVYSTLFRTYFDKEEFNQRKSLYILTPFLCWVLGTLLYSIDALVFWRAMTYFAVFHFVRQQYGLMMIYARSEKINPLFKKIDRYAIYSSTLYPLIYWHTHLPRQFDWFMANDFVVIHSARLNQCAFLGYVLIIMAYLGKEIYVLAKYRRVNLAKNLVLFGTALSWWLGIVYFNHDLAFTAINVISHGIPYMALIWIYGHHHGKLFPGKKMFGKVTFGNFFSLKMLPLFIGSLLLWAYLEEGLWDGLIWQEHQRLFQMFQSLPNITDKTTLAWLIPLLSLPQTTHYALDAFIWRLTAENSDWKKILFYSQRQP